MTTLARSSLLLLGLSALIAGDVHAASAPDGPNRAASSRVEADSTGRLVAPVLEVEGRRIGPQGRIDRDTGFGSVIDAASWEGQGASTADVLSRAAGVHVRSSGGVGGFATVSLRGSTPAQVPVYLDGMLLNGGDRGAVNLADLDLAHLDRIEVYRGSAPLTLGGASLGGAIHLFSAASGGSWNGSLTRGSHETWNADGQGSLRLGDWTVVARARAVRSRNDWDFLDDRGTIYNDADDAVVPRVNNDAEGFGAQLQASRPFAGGTLRFGEIVDTREQGLPGRGVRQSETARGRVTTHRARVAWRSKPLVEGLLREVSLKHRTEVVSVVDRDGSLSGAARDRTDRLHAIGIDASGAAVPYGDTVWRIETRGERLRSVDRARVDGDGEPQYRWSTAFGAQPRWQRGRLLISPGARGEFHEQWWNRNVALDDLPRGDSRRSSLWSYTAQLGVRWSFTDELHLKSNLGVYRRVPTLLELFGDRGTTGSNPDLRPEEGVNRDVGLVWSESGTGRRFALTAFVNDSFDLITFVKTSPVTARARNLGRAEIRGFEFEADFGRFGPFGFHLAATRLWSEDETDDAVAGGRALPFRPGIEVEAGQTLHVGRLRLGIDLFAMGENYQQTGERLRVPSRAILGAHARWRLDRTWSVHARIENLGDDAIQDFVGEPLPGRTFMLTLEAGGR